MALSAASPIYKGQITDQDHRWDVFTRATDGRTESEQDPEQMDYKVKPRFSAATRYISNHEYTKDYHNDLEGRVRQCDTSYMLLD